MKRLILSLFLVLSLQLVHGAGTKIGDLYYDLDSSTLTAKVTYEKRSAFYNYLNLSGALSIPEEVDYDGKTFTVTSIGDEAFSYCSGLTSVEIPNSVTEIGAAAFYGCSGLTSVEIPNSVTEIRGHTFSNCSGLTSVVIPNSVTEIGYWAFSGCSGLTSVEIPNSVTEIGAAAFYGCSGLETIHFNAENCIACGFDPPTFPSNVKTLVIGDVVKTIPDYAFKNCIGLTSVEIPNSVTSIGKGAFRFCSGLTSVEIPNSVTEIGNEAFSYCSGLTSVEISDLEAWCRISFGNGDSNPLSFAHRLYLNGKEITELKIPDSVTSIGKYAFKDCSGLTSMEIPNSVTSIGYSAFSYCSGLTSIEIPNSVTEIGEYAFLGCSGLTSIVIGESVREIGDNAFRECPMLKEVYALPVAPPLVVTNDLFDSQIYSSATLYVAEKSLERYKIISPWSYFSNIVGKDFENGEKPEPTQIRILPVLFPGESMKLCAVAEQDSAFESLSWSSSDSSIISVNGAGVANALGLGSASITATTENGISAVLEILVIEDDGSASVDLNIVNEYSKQNVYTLDGILLIENAIPEEIRLLSPGIYIIGGKKVMVK